jgi:hypothetical protein
VGDNRLHSITDSSVEELNNVLGILNFSREFTALPFKMHIALQICLI